jgi:hypothetical protein
MQLSFRGSTVGGDLLYHQGNLSLHFPGKSGPYGPANSVNQKTDNAYLPVRHGTTACSVSTQGITHIVNHKLFPIVCVSITVFLYIILSGQGLDEKKS